MSKIKRLLVPLSAILILSLLGSGCAVKPAGLSDGEVAEVAENILRAINENDYLAFIRDFSDAMEAAFPEDQFAQLGDMLQSTSGDYLSKGAPDLSNLRGYAVYKFPCKFEKEDVVVTVVFAVGGEEVEGLYFDSPNLRNANP